MFFLKSNIDISQSRGVMAILIHPDHSVWNARTKRMMVAMFCAAAICFGPVRAGTIRGSVHSRETNEAIVGANVYIPGTGLGAASGPRGEFKIGSIPKGTYSLRVDMVGYKSREVSRVTIEADTSVVSLDIRLEEAPVNIAEVVIRARANRELESTGIRNEFEANNIISVITAQTIERSTDRTAADVLQRVAGLSLIRSNGEGRYVVMRGLEQRYNNTLVDGIRIPSPESKDRFVPMDIFPSGLFEQIEVTKALTPERAGDAIGGSTNLMLREAPENFVFSINALTGGTSRVLGKSFNTFDRSAVAELDPDRLAGSVSDLDPTTLIKPRTNPTSAEFSVNNLRFSSKNAPLDGLYSSIIGGRLFEKRIGVIASGSYQNTYSTQLTDSYSLGSDVNTIDAEGHLLPYASTHSNRNFFINKTRVGASVKMDFIADEDHQLSTTYMFVRQEEAQVRNSLSTQIDGTRGSADLTYGYRSALRTQNISSISLAGSHFTTTALSVRWTLNYTDAVQDRPDEAEYTVLRNFDPYGNIQPFQGLGGITHSWRKNDDRQYLGKTDALWRVTSDGMHTLQVGVILQKLDRANFQNDYKLNPAIIKGSTQPFTSIDSAITVPFGFGSTSGSSVYGYQNYKAYEFMISLYGQYTFVMGPLQILTGLRWEMAKDTFYTMAPKVPGQNSATVKFVDFLPGIHFRYEFAQGHIGRLSFTRSMSRPSYFDLVPASERSDNSSSTGNPSLRPAHSSNLDLKYEYYANTTDLLSLGFYYKRITDPIEDQFSSAGVVFNTSKGNGNPATVYGYEAVVSKKLWNFRISGNYSYVVSKITNAKLVPVLDPYGDPVVPVPVVQQTRPLQSQSPHLANIILSYQDDDWGTGMNVSYNYTGRRLLAVAQIDGYDTYENGVGELDFAAEQQLFANLKLNLKLINLLRSSVVTEVAPGDYIKHPPIIIQQDFNKLRGSIGISYRF